MNIEQKLKIDKLQTLKAEVAKLEGELGGEVLTARDGSLHIKGDYYYIWNTSGRPDKPNIVPLFSFDLKEGGGYSFVDADKDRWLHFEKYEPPIVKDKGFPVGYVTRTYKGALIYSASEPVLDHKDNQMHFPQGHNQMNPELFPELTWEDSPRLLMSTGTMEIV